MLYAYAIATARGQSNTWGGAGEGDSVVIVNVTFFSSHTLAVCARCNNPNGESNRFRVPEISVPQVKELVAIRCIADDSAADHGHKRCDSPPHALFSQALCVPDVPASQPSSEVPVRPTSPCLLLALRRQAVPSREKELFDMFR